MQATNAHANAPKVILFMTRSHVVTPRKKASRLRDADLDRLLGADQVFTSKTDPYALVALSIQALFCRRRHQARRPPLAKIRPGRPAPTIGPGTGQGPSEQTVTSKPNAAKVIRPLSPTRTPSIKALTLPTAPLLKSTKAIMLPASRPIRVMLNVSLQRGGQVSPLPGGCHRRDRSY
jgi:hypothetical protein